jgi:hypothetical protein
MFLAIWLSGFVNIIDLIIDLNLGAGATREGAPLDFGTPFVVS